MNMIDWITLGENLLKLALSLILSLPIAWNRERATRIMGLRTYPLVAIGCCGYVLVSNSFLPDAAPDAQARVLQGLVSGIGFVGGGAILKDKDHVEGTATAASIWAIGAVGAAVAHNSYEIAIVIALVIFLLLQWLTPLKQKIDEASS
jgi:putative Mg2+ transporter-C (MgtC) family protein